MKSWGLARIVIRGVWRIIIMAEGRMAIARVALNMVGGGGGVESGEAWWCWMYNRYRHRSFTAASLARQVGGCMPGLRRVANWLCAVSAQSAHRHPHNFTDDLTSATSNCRRTNNLHSPKPTAIMSDNENGEEMVTKPFKFVTGTPPVRPQCLL